jgi:phosphoribosylformimino-5-aminoimidazole carboxamide ribotide isomerase
MKIIPVIDILNGKVVHAKGGRRNLYKPIKSSLFSSFRPIEVLKKLENIGFSMAYIADLDSIMNKNINYHIYNQIKSISNIELIVDAGIINKDMILSLLKTNIKKVIIATETLSSLKFLKDAIKKYGKDRIILSLDLSNKKIVNKINLRDEKNPVAFLKVVEIFGLSQVIILDLARIGSKKGVDNVFIKKICSEINIEVFIGGGIRSISDLIFLNKLGVKGVLIGTALYSKAITVSELKKNNFLI